MGINRNLVQKQKKIPSIYTKQTTRDINKKNLKLQNFKCNYSLASTLKKKYVYTILKKKEFLLLNFFKLSNSEKLKNEERKILFSHIYFCCHMVSRKKAKKNFHHHQKIYIPSNFLATLNSKIKKNEFSCPKK